MHHSSPNSINFICANAQSEKVYQIVFYFYIVASVCIYLVAYTAVKNGSGFEPPLFEKRITAIGLTLLAVGVVLEKIPHAYPDLYIPKPQ